MNNVKIQPTLPSAKGPQRGTFRPPAFASEQLPNLSMNVVENTLKVLYTVASQDNFASDAEREKAEQIYKTLYERYKLK